VKYFLPIFNVSAESRLDFQHKQLQKSPQTFLIKGGNQSLLHVLVVLIRSLQNLSRSRYIPG